MLTKIFPTGQGRGYGPVEYLCSVNPFGRGEREKAPEVLSGNPALIRKQIDTIPFKHKYTSGVHSFAPEDKPTDEQIMEVIEATEELAFAGLPLSSRSILWVKHEHNGRIELHFLIPRQEVNSGKSFNAFPPGWQQKYDPLRDKFNYKYGWARPDDPERARHWQPGINAEILVDAKRKGKPNPKAEVFSLTDELANMAMQGKLSNRSEIISELRKRGYGINRQGKDYLTIIDKEGKKTRLKGTLFAENFNGPGWIKAEIAKIDKPDSEKVLIDQKLAAEADTRLQEAIRKTAIYNSNLYAIKEDKNEQSTGRETGFKSEMDAGNVGSGNERASGKPASFQKPTDSKRNESHALYSEPGLGENATDQAACGTIRGNAGNSLQENSLPDSSSSSVGRTVGTGSEMAESHRRSVERFHEWSDTNSSDSFRAGAGDYRRQSEKPGRNDGADHGHVERTARKGEWTGELIQKFRSLKKGTQKLEERLDRINQGDKKLPAIDPDLRPALENMEQIARMTIRDLRQAHETRLLQDILRQSVNTAPIATGNLLISGDEAVKSLRAGYEQKLLQKLAKSGSPLALAELEKFSRLASGTQHNLVLAHNIKFVADLAKELSNLHVTDLESLTQAAKQVSHTLREVADFRQMEQLKRILPTLEAPSLQILVSKGKITCDSLKKANDFMIMRKMYRHTATFDLPGVPRLAAWSRFVLKKLKRVQQIRIMNEIYKAEKERAKSIKNCYFHAEWAGSDLQRWDRIFAEYEKSPKKLKIFEGMLEAAHSKFALILSDTQNLAEIQNRCGIDPFLLHEYGILKEKVEHYYTEKRAQKAEQTKVQKPEFKNEKSEEVHNSAMIFRP